MLALVLGIFAPLGGIYAGTLQLVSHSLQFGDMVGALLIPHLPGQHRGKGFYEKRFGGYAVLSAGEF
jgi:hypothetical protein